MARQEEPREDLMREATALRERAELRLPGRSEPLVVGFRASGAASVFVGDDLSYQFNAAGELRRAFAGGRLIKADGGKLAALKRERSEEETALVRHDLSSDETRAFLAAARELLLELETALSEGSARFERQHPAEADLVGRIRRWLAGLPEELLIASTPRAGG